MQEITGNTIANLFYINGPSTIDIALSDEARLTEIHPWWGTKKG